MRWVTIQKSTEALIPGSRMPVTSAILLHRRISLSGLMLSSGKQPGEQAIPETRTNDSLNTRRQEKY